MSIKTLTRLTFVSLIIATTAMPAAAGTRTLLKETMSFNDCLQRIRTMSTNLGQAPKNIVETGILRIVRFKTNDGSGKSILVTCSKRDRTVLINESW